MRLHSISESVLWQMVDGRAPQEAAVFVPFLLAVHRRDLMEVLQSTELDRHFGVPISLAELSAHSPAAAEALLQAPRQMLLLLDTALGLAQDRLRCEADAVIKPSLTLKDAVHARLSGLAFHLDGHPLARELCPSAGGVASAHIDRLITIAGTVCKAGPIKMLQARRLYECTRCKHRFVLQADMEMGGTVQLPSTCPSQRDKPCKGANFRHCEEVALFTNWQEVRVQEHSGASSSSGTPRALTVLLQDDLADCCQVGDEVEVTGVVIRQFGPLIPGVRCQVGLALQATNVTVATERKAAVEVTAEAAQAFQQFWAAHEGSPLLGRNKIIASVCPELHGLFNVKLATLLMLIGGVARGGDGGGSRVRGEVHMLLVGDPGTGKSQFQKYVAKLAPRSVITSGRASSAAGLTAAAVHDGAGWSLEAGALVLADGGVCLIDEFDGIPERDRASIHEAMEQQTTSVAKAGMMVSLHTRAAVFATCNPGRNQRYNPRLPLTAQLNIGGPLLSRFDVVILLLDNMDPAWDEVVATHLLDTHQRRGGKKAAQAAAAAGGRWGQPTQQQDAEEGPGGWPLASLRQYVQWAKTSFEPTMGEPAEQLLSAYFQLRRQHEGRQSARTTVRMLESLVRLAQAHARLMARNEVALQDAVVAVWLMESSCVDSQSSALGHMLAAHGVQAPGGAQSFPDDPDAEYAALESAMVAAVLGSGGGWGGQPRYLQW